MGKSPARIAFFRTIMEESPVTEMTPKLVSTAKPESLADNVHVFAKDGEYYLAYVARKGNTISLDLPADAVYKVELIDTWNMTTKPLPDATPGTFKIKTPIPYCAIRIIGVDPS